jgi:hypothetical protein
MSICLLDGQLFILCDKMSTPILHAPQLHHCSAIVRAGTSGRSSGIGPEAIGAAPRSVGGNWQAKN